MTQNFQEAPPTCRLCDVPVQQIVVDTETVEISDGLVVRNFPVEDVITFQPCGHTYPVDPVAPLDQPATDYVRFHGDASQPRVWLYLPQGQSLEEAIKERATGAKPEL